MARGKLIRGNHRAQLHVKKGRWPHAIGPVSARLRMRWEKAHIRSANLDPYGDWIEICSDAQNL